MAGHSGGKAFAIVLNFLVFGCLIALLFMSAFWTNGAFFSWGVFGGRNFDLTAESVQDSPESRETMINPPVWCFLSMWGLSYVWTFLWILYSLYTLCARSYSDGYLYAEPNYMPTWIFGGMILFGAMNGAWLFMEDQFATTVKENDDPSGGMFDEIGLGLLGGMTFFGIIGTGVSIAGVRNHSKEMKKINQRSHLIWAMGLIHNGFAMLTTWAFVSVHYKLCQILIYEMQMGEETAHVIVLTILAVALPLWFCLDIFAFWRYTLFTITPYVVVFVYLTGCVTRNIEPLGTIPIYLYVLMSVSGLLLFFKIFMMCACWVGSNDLDEREPRKWVREMRKRRPRLRRRRRRRRREPELIAPQHHGGYEEEMGYGASPYDMVPPEVDLIPVPSPVPVPVYIDEPYMPGPPCPQFEAPPPEPPPPPPPAPAPPPPEPIIIQAPAPVVVPAPPPPPIIVIREEAPKPEPCHCPEPAPLPPPPCPQPVMVPQPQPVIVPVRVAQPPPVIVRQVVQQPQVLVPQPRPQQPRQILVKKVVQKPGQGVLKLKRVTTPGGATAGGGNMVLKTVGKPMIVAAGKGGAQVFKIAK